MEEDIGLVLDDSAGEFPEEEPVEGEPEEGATEDEASDEESSSEDSSKSKKKKKNGKGKISPETTRFIGLFLVIAVIIIVCGYIGIKMIEQGLVLGIIVIAAGLAGAIFVLMINVNRLKMYEKMTDMTKKAYEKESVKLDEDMEKCQGRIAALDARAEERGKDAPPPKE